MPVSAAPDGAARYLRKFQTEADMPIRRVKPKNTPPQSTSARLKAPKARPVQITTVHEPALLPAGEGAEDYEVGYRKPPKSGQFKRGQSGNPKGRPKGARSLDSMALSMLKERILIKTPEGMRKVPKIEALLMKQVEKASKGDAKALQTLLSLYESAVSEEQKKTAISGNDASASDKVILQMMRQQFASESNASEAK